MSEQRGDQGGTTSGETKRKWTISRRSFLIGMAASGTALALGIPLGLPVARRQMAQLVEGDTIGFPADVEPLAWFEVLPDDSLRLYVTKAEMGQGVHTGLAQIAAEELEIPWERLEVIHASTNRGDDNNRLTAGSTTIKSLYEPLRQGAATLREMLRAQAAIYLNLPAEQLLAREGAFELINDPAVRVTYGNLVTTGVDWQVPKEDVPLKPASEFQIIGRSLPRVDARIKVTGQAIYGYDTRIEGMLYGAVVRPPTLEARIMSARPGQAASMPGVVQVVIEEGFAGVVAESRLQAYAARDALEIEWDEGYPWQQEELEAIVTAGGPDGVNIQREGRARSMLAQDTPITAEYRVGFAAHAPLEPQAALAEVRGGAARVWTSTQSESSVRRNVAEALGFKPEQVEIIPTYLGGGFGRKASIKPVVDVGVEAARLSKAVGAPVHVGWDRVEEMRSGFFRPLTHHKLSAILNGQGRIEAMAYQEASGNALTGSFPKAASRVIGFDFGATRGTLLLYDIPHRDVTVWKHELPIATGTWRGVGLFPNIFPIESFVDELAYVAGADPLQFRLDHLPPDLLGQRMRAVLETAAEQAGWGSALLEGRAQGIACCVDAGTVVAEVAEVSLDRERGQIKVHRVVAAMDCGRAINPNGVKAQMEGAIVMGTSAALLEAIVVKDGRVEAGNFDRYPLLRHRDAPEIETILLDAPDGRPRGVGEPPIGPIAPAIANAFFALTGLRLRRLPMTPERVKGALEESS